MEKLRKLIINGPDVHPGANYLEYQDGRKVFDFFTFLLLSFSFFSFFHLT